MDNLDGEIRTIVSRVIKMPEDRVLPDTDLFRELGVDSLLAVEIFATLDKKYNITLDEKKISKARKLSDIIRLVKEQANA